MTLAAIGWTLFSVSGLLVLLIVGVVWLWARRESPAPRRFLLVVIATYSLAAYAPFATRMSQLLSTGFRPLERDDVLPGRSVVVLLGSGSYRRSDWSGTSASFLDGIGAERTLEAARVYRLVDADAIISSGGAPDPRTHESTGRTMKEFLVRLGVPADRVLVEEQSSNTLGEAVVVAGLLPGLHADHVILVTSQIHMRRALGLFRANGIRAIPAVSFDGLEGGRISRFLPSGLALDLSSRVAHEVVGLAYSWLRGDFIPTSSGASTPAPR